MGGVVLDWTPRRIAGYFTSEKEAVDILCAELFSNKEWLELDRGVTDEETALKGICARVPEKYHALCRKVIYEWYNFFLPLPYTYEQVIELKKRGYSLYMLTNASVKVRVYQKNSPVFALMDGIVVSAEEHMLKPEEGIYLRLLEKYGLKAEECLFFDDVEVNVRAAEKLGFYGHVFRGEPGEILKTVDGITADGRE